MDDDGSGKGIFLRKTPEAFFASTIPAVHSVKCGKI
jgi:hypothetical protein